MQKIIIILFVIHLAVSSSGNAQNLVINPSLEKYDTCPFNMGQINFSNNWFSPAYPSSTSEYYNACDLTNQVGVPISGNGAVFQYARTGCAYGGIALYVSDNPNYREYIEATLLTPLIAGKNYCIKFYVNKVGIVQFAIDAIGAYLSNDSVLYSAPPPTLLTKIPQINNPTNNIITDTVNWVKISGSFTASGGEQFITIGNFNNDASTNTQYMGGGLPGGAYYFIDDVSVYPCDAPVYIADAGSDQTICIGAIDSVQIGSAAHNEYIYWWTPATGLSNDSIANPKARPAVTTTYYLHQKDFKFDETVDSITVVVEDCPANNLIIVNAFTPNADGVNDVFHIKGTNIKELHAKIINRWGQVLYEWNDPAGGGTGSNAGWDGRYKGMDVGAGAYFYVVTVVYEDGTIEEKKGAIELIR